MYYLELITRIINKLENKMGIFEKKRLREN